MGIATLTTGFGDCEDYAIAKYVALVEAGVAAEDVRLIIARDLVRPNDALLACVDMSDDDDRAPRFALGVDGMQDVEFQLTFST